MHIVPVIIEPENASLQDAPVLLLGHVSEYHYYSLKRSDGEYCDSDNNDDGQSTCIPQ